MDENKDPQLAQVDVGAVTATAREATLQEVIADLKAWRAKCRPEQDEVIRLAIVRVEQKLAPAAEG